jgi:hypothetical protein
MISWSMCALLAPRAVGLPAMSAAAFYGEWGWLIYSVVDFSS